MKKTKIYSILFLAFICQINAQDSSAVDSVSKRNFQSNIKGDLLSFRRFSDNGHAFFISRISFERHLSRNYSFNLSLNNPLVARWGLSVGVRKYLNPQQNKFNRGLYFSSNAFATYKERDDERVLNGSNLVDFVNIAPHLNENKFGYRNEISAGLELGLGYQAYLRKRLLLNLEAGYAPSYVKRNIDFFNGQKEGFFNAYYWNIKFGYAFK